MKAPEARRATQDATLKFGLVVIPIQVFSGVSDDAGLSRKSISPEGNPVGRQNIDKVTGEVVSHEDILHCVETQHGWVEVENWEVDEVCGIPTRTLDVEATVAMRELHNEDYVPSGLHHVRPKGDSAIEPLSLLLKALKQTHSFALVAFSVRGKPRRGALLPDGRLFTLHAEEEVRQAPSLELTRVKRDDLNKAVQLVKSSRQERPGLADTFTSNVMAYANKKAKTGKTVEVKDPETHASTDVSKALTTMVG